MADDTLTLCYHAVSEDWPSELAVTPAALRRQISFLLGQGYRATTFTDAVVGDPPGKVLAITFDDAYESTFALARGVLAELGVPGTVFVPTDFPDSGVPFPLPGAAWIGTEHEPELICMSWEQIRRLRDEGWEIGAHSRSHPWLTQIDDARLHDELRGSRAVLERELGTAPGTIAYPYGDHDDRVVAATAAAGYTAACTVPHRFEEFGSTPLRMARIDVTRSESQRAFRLRTAGWTRRARRTEAARGGRWLDQNRPRRSTVLAAVRRQRRRLAVARALRDAAVDWRQALRADLGDSRLRRIRFRDGVDFRFERGGADGLERFAEIFVDGDCARHLSVEPGDFVVDVGAASGLFAIYALRRGADRIVCFEGDPELAAVLRDNVARNRLDRISVDPDAVTGSLDPLRAIAAAADRERVDLLRLATPRAGALVAGASDRALGGVDRLLVRFEPGPEGPRIDEVVRRLEAAGFETWIDLDHDSGAGWLAARAGGRAAGA